MVLSVKINFPFKLKNALVTLIVYVYSCVQKYVYSNFLIWHVPTSDGRVDNYVYVSEALMAGITAGAVESLVVSPFEIIKLRAQVTSASRISSHTSVVERSAVSPLIARLLSGYSPDIRAMNNSVGLLSTLTAKHPNMIDSLKEFPWTMTGTGKPPSVIEVRRPSDVFSFEGIGTFWRGLRSGVARDSIFGGIFFSTWQLQHRAMLDWKAVAMKPPPRFFLVKFPLVFYI